MNKTTKRVLGVFSLAMMTAGSVDSLRNLPTTALFGSKLIFFFLFGAILFLLPSALVSAELASTSSEHGGVYAWVKQAFGIKLGFLAVWFQWIENVIYYPTILSFVAGTIGYLIAPQLAASKAFLMTVILVAFWGMTVINLFGIKTSAWFSNFAAVCGLLIPMALIIALGAAWVVEGHTLQINLHPHAWLPHLHQSHLWVALTGVMLSFSGMEIATVHGKDVKNPQRNYARAMLLATVIILVTMLFGALSIAIVLPSKEISLVAGIMQAFGAFFSAYHLRWILPVIAFMLVLGGLGTVNNWIIAPTRGLLLALQEGGLVPHLQRTNKHQAPQNLLLYQAMIASIVTLVFLLMPSVNGSYWLLTVLAAQLYMLMYILMFAAAIRLRYKKSPRHKGFMIPGGNLGIWLVAGAGLVGSTITLLVGFIPPQNINIGSVLRYESLLIAGLFIMSVPAWCLYHWGHVKVQRRRK
ncbi:MAG: APC family permease [Gammaproteobacteria bacterium]|nr:APC family permease [Gammaproteobacteria bacterium]